MKVQLFGVGVLAFRHGGAICKIKRLFCLEIVDGGSQWITIGR